MKTIAFYFFLLLLAEALVAQFNMDSLNKLKDSEAVKDKVNMVKDTAANPPKDNPNVEKMNALKESSSKNEKKKDFFTGGEKLGVAQTVMELKDDPTPANKKILLVAGGMDSQYTVFNGNKEFAIYRMNSLPPGASNTQFAIRKKLEKEAKQVYKKGEKLPGGYYEIVGTKTFPEFTFDQTPLIVIEEVALKMF